MTLAGRAVAVLAALAALAAGLATAAAASAATSPDAKPAPASAKAAPPAPAKPAPAVPAPVAHPSAASVATPAPIPLHAPADPSAARSRLLVAINSVDEGFLLGLPGASPKGPVAYVPPQPKQDTDDAAGLLLAAAAGLLAAIGGGAVLLFVLLRPRRAAAAPPARASVALPPQSPAEVALEGRPRRTTRVSQEAFDRLPPLLQLSILDRAGPHFAYGGSTTSRQVPGIDAMPGTTPPPPD